jgi:hypothetical protein
MRTTRDALSWLGGVVGAELSAGSGGEPGFDDEAVL